MWKCPKCKALNYLCGQGCGCCGYYAKGTPRPWRPRPRSARGETQKLLERCREYLQDKESATIREMLDMLGLDGSLTEVNRLSAAFHGDIKSQEPRFEKVGANTFAIRRAELTDCRAKLAKHEGEK